MERKYFRRDEGEELGKFGADSDADCHSSSGSFNSYDNEEEEMIPRIKEGPFESEESWLERMAVEANPYADCPENEPWGP